jgi:hypothetical protein
MNTELGRYVELRSVVSYFSDQYDKSEGDQDKFWLLGLRGLMELNFDVTAEPKTVRLPVAGNKTVAFPSDLISWVKVGVLNNEGEISTLKINNALTTFKDNNPNRLSRLTADISDSILALGNSPTFFNYYFNGFCYNLFGVGGGLIQYGECRIDDGNDLIVLSPDFKYDTIFLEYISSPEKDSDYMVPMAFQEAIIAFIEWKLKLNTADNFYAEVVKGRRRWGKKKVTLQGINQVIRESESQKLRS